MLSLLLLAVGASALQVRATDDTTNLSPILSPEADTSSKANIVPSNSVTLTYGLDGSAVSLASVALALQYPAVLLEEVGAAATVQCTDGSVSVTFSNADSYAAAVKDWAAPFVLFTNHWGGCDVDYERGVFLASAVEANDGALTIVASTQRTDVRGVAVETEITFSTIPLASASRRRSHPRDIVIGDNGVTLTNTLALSDKVLYSYDPYFTLTADDASLNTAVTLSGRVVYHIENLTLSELSFDVDVTSTASLTVTAEATAPYSQTFKYEPADLTYSFVNIPGILTIGPALGFAIGAEVAVEAAVTATATQTLSFADAKLHLDFVDTKKTGASGWEPKYTAKLDLTEKAKVEINPFVEVTVELQFEILSGALDLSGGLTARPKFNNAATLAAGQVIHDDGTVDQPSTGETCDQGVYVVSTFEFDLIAFVTQFWSDTIYSVVVPLADKCYSWL